MPIHDLGYQTWHGRVLGQASRWWVITRTGWRLAWANRWVRRWVLLAWLPAFYLGAGFFLFETYVTQMNETLPITAGDRAQAEHWLRWEAEHGPSRHGPRHRRPERPQAIVGDPSQPQREFTQEEIDAKARELVRRRAERPIRAMFPWIPEIEGRHDVWAYLLFVFFRYPQGVLMVLVVGLIAPPLIAQDVRTRAFLLYFSRPLSRMEYIVGKLAVVSGYLVLITTIPALVLYFVGVLLSPEISVVAETWDLPLRIVAASIVLIVPTTAMALAFSSLTSETRYAAFSWFAAWAVGWVTYTVVFRSVGTEPHRRWTLVSLYHTLGEVQSCIFGIGPSLSDVWAWIVLLAGVTGISLVVLFHRVSSPMRA